MVNNEFPPLGGGTGTVNQVLLRRLASVPGINVDLITSALRNRPEEIPFSDRIRIFKVPVNNRILHHSSPRELTTFAARALPLAWRLHRKCCYDLCLAWSGVPAGAVALALSRLKGLRYVVRVGGPDIPGFERRYRMLYPGLKPLIRLIWRSSENIVAKCEGEAAMIRAVDWKANICIIPNGVDIDYFPRADSLSGNGPLRLICVARLIERKGQGHLIEAVKRLTDEGIDVSLDLVGTGDAQETYEAQARSLGVEGRVHFCGYIPREEIPKCYSVAQVFVLPSHNEGMSVATLEAMAAGLPLVVTRTPGTAQMVEEGVNGWTFSWGDVEGLTGHLRRLAMDRDLAETLGSASRARAARFSWDRAFEGYLALFQRIITPSTPICSSGICSSAEGN